MAHAITVKFRQGRAFRITDLCIGNPSIAAHGFLSQKANNAKV